MENWKEIENFNGQYLISDQGRILSKGNQHSRKDKILKPHSHHTTNHLKVNLYCDGVLKKMFVHRLVALAFVSNPDNKPCVNHKDNDPLNNSVTNLEWVTHQENSDHYYASYFSPKVPEVKDDSKRVYKLISTLLRKTNLTAEQLKSLL